MKIQRLIAMAAFLAVFVFAASAFAQGSVSLPPVTPTIGIVMALSVLAGVLTSWIQSGTLLGRWITPKSWLPDVTMLYTFLSGFLGYVTSQTPVVLTGSAIFYGVMYGIVSLTAGVAPGIAMHVHSELPRLRLAARKATAVPPAPPSAPSATAPAVALAGGLLAMIVVVCGALLSGATTTACTAQQAKAAEQAIVQIAVDACQEAPQLVPPGLAGVVTGLLCQVIDQQASDGGLLSTRAPAYIAASSWNAMKVEYAAKHDGKLPAGMTLPAGGGK